MMNPACGPALEMSGDTSCSEAAALVVPARTRFPWGSAAIAVTDPPVAKQTCACWLPRGSSLKTHVWPEDSLAAATKMSPDESTASACADPIERCEPGAPTGT